MSYQEKRTIVMSLTSLVVLIAYAIDAFGRGMADLTDLKAWAGKMLLYLVITVVAVIVVQIVFHITVPVSMAVRTAVANRGEVDEVELERKIKTEFIEDEMGKLIELKASRVGMIIAGVGFFSGLVSLLLEQPPAVMLNILFFAFGSGSIFEAIAQMIFYRRGV